MFPILVSASIFIYLLSQIFCSKGTKENAYRNDTKFYLSVFSFRTTFLPFLIAVFNTTPMTILNFSATTIFLADYLIQYRQKKIVPKIKSVFHSVSPFRISAPQYQQYLGMPSPSSSCHCIVLPQSEQSAILCPSSFL